MRHVFLAYRLMGNHWYLTSSFGVHAGIFLITLSFFTQLSYTNSLRKWAYAQLNPLVL